MVNSANYDDMFDEPMKGDEGHKARLDKIEDTLCYVKDKYWGIWQKYIRLYKGDHWGPYQNEDAQFWTADNYSVRITVNLIGPYINQLVAYVLASDPHIKVNPLNIQEREHAILSEVAVNYEWKQRDYKKQLKRIAKMAYTVGWCPAKVGYALDVDKTAKPDEDGYLDYNSFIKEDAPYLKYISPFCFIYDLAAEDKTIDTARWVCEIYFQDPSYVVNNERYDEKVRNYIRKNSGGRWGKPKTDNQYPEDSYKDQPEAIRNLYTIYDFWDKKDRKRYVYCKGVTKPLIEETPPEWKGPQPYIKGFPYKILPFIEEPNEWFAIGLIKWIEMSQYELNRHRTGLWDHRKKNMGGQWQVDPDVPEEERKNHKKGLPHILVPGILSGQEGFRPLPQSPIPPEQFQMDRINMADIDFITGLSIIQGVPSPGRRAATEIRQRGQFASLRLDDIADTMDDFVRDIASDTLKHIKANYDVPKMFEIAGPLAEYWGRVTNQPPGQNGEYWVKFDNNAIVSEFGIDIVSGSKPKVDPQVDQASRLQYANFLFTLSQFGLSLMIQSKGAMGLKNVGGINLEETAKWVGEAYGFDADIPRLIPSAAVIPPPIMLQTGFDQQHQQQGGGMPTNFQAQKPPTQESQDQGEGAGMTPESMAQGMMNAS